MTLTPADDGADMPFLASRDSSKEMHRGKTNPTDKTLTEGIDLCPPNGYLHLTLPITLSFMAGILTATVLALSVFHSPYHPNTNTSSPDKSASDHPTRNLPDFHPGTEPITHQPASWFNGPCGASGSTARARNCTFHLVLHAWLPRDCLTAQDHADARLMYTNQSWHWAIDNATEISLDRVGQGEHGRVWTSFDWHVVHCAYVWKRLHRALLDGEVKVDSYTASYGHTGHCVDMVGVAVGGEDMRKMAGTQVFVKYPSCA